MSLQDQLRQAKETAARTQDGLGNSVATTDLLLRLLHRQTETISIAVRALELSIEDPFAFEALQITNEFREYLQQARNETLVIDETAKDLEQSWENCACAACETHRTNKELDSQFGY